jgi:membrane protein
MENSATSTRSWKNVLRYVKASISADHLSIVAPGVAFYLMLGIVPGLVALISIYGLVSDPQDVQGHFERMSGAMPEEAHALLSEQMERIAEESAAAGVGALIGIAVALWSASQAVSALMQGLNITYDTRETRGTVKQIAIRLALTLAVVVFGLLAIAVLVVVPPVLNALPIPGFVAALLSLARWPVLFLIAVIAIALLYSYAPNRERAPFRWITLGSAIAAVLWLIGSALFSLYVANFAAYNETYGALGAVVILLLWLLITAYVILIGAEIDDAFERDRHKAEDPVSDL